jgi:preprotein translocase subunit SecE
MNKINTYIKSSVEEMKKVTWPTKKETYNYTVMIIVISLSMALFIGLLDYGFDALIKNFLYKL